MIKCWLYISMFTGSYYCLKIETIVVCNLVFVILNFMMHPPLSSNFLSCDLPIMSWKKYCRVLHERGGKNFKLLTFSVKITVHCCNLFPVSMVENSEVGFSVIKFLEEFKGCPVLLLAHLFLQG